MKLDTKTALIRPTRRHRPHATTWAARKCAAYIIGLTAERIYARHNAAVPAEWVKVLGDIEKVCDGTYSPEHLRYLRRTWNPAHQYDFDPMAWTKRDGSKPGSRITMDIDTISHLRTVTKFLLARRTCVVHWVDDALRHFKQQLAAGK